MPNPTPSQSKEILTRELTMKAALLWGKERAGVLGEMLEEHAEHLIALSKALPPSQEVPTMTWQNHA